MSKKASSIDAIGQLVPDGPQRERFFELMAAYRNAPKDDEQLQFMEIVGFTTLILKDLPDEMAAALEKAQSGLSDDQANVMARRFETILKDSIDTPSYKDLRESVQQIKEERQQFQRNVEGVSHAIKELPAIPYRGTHKTSALVWTAIASLIVGALSTSSVLLLTKIRLPQAVEARSAPAFTDPLPVMVEYFEDTLPNYRDPVGIYVVTGGVLEVAQEPDKGIVVVALADSPLPH